MEYGARQGTKPRAPNPKPQAPEKLQSSSSKPRPEWCGGHPDGAL